MCCCKQQTPECSYTFMGIPIEGNTDEFGQKLCEAGFTKGANIPGVEFLFKDRYQGKFCSREAYIDLLQEDDKVFGAQITFPIPASVSINKQCLDIYKELRNMLDKKYNNDDWIILTDQIAGNSISTMADDEILFYLEELNDDFYYRIYPKNTDYDPRPYISLSLGEYTKKGLTILYQNPRIIEDLLNNRMNDL